MPGPDSSGIGLGWLPVLSRRRGAGRPRVDLGLDWLFLLSRGRRAADRSGSPITVLGGLLGRFKERPDLVAALPGRMLPGVPSGPLATPYATIQFVGERDEWATRGKGRGGYRVVYTTFLVAVCGDDEGKAAEAWDALKAEFNPAALAADPIPLRKGRINSATVGRVGPAASEEQDRGGNLVRRRAGYLTTISVDSY